MATRPAAGGGRVVDVPPERLARWLENFAERHEGAPLAAPIPNGLRLTAPDGVVAECRLPFGGAPVDVPQLISAAAVERRVGLLLARRGAFAVGVAEGARLRDSKTDRRYVQSRTAAGGWSQQRFARRRANQARQSAQAAGEAAARVLLPERDRLDVIVLGGDRKAVDQVLEDRRLAPLVPKVGGWFLDVPEPRQAVLQQAAQQARAVRITLLD